MCSRVPLVIILGATGTGKTKLSLELAEKYQTEIISADSMQIYKGLDIVSAKATVDERSRVPHHIIDFLQPHQTYTVIDFRNAAIKIIDEMLSQNKIPIVVGGTNYYIESILWKILVEELNTSGETKLVSERDQEKRDIKKLKLESHASSEISSTSKQDNQGVSDASDLKTKSACARDKTSTVNEIDDFSNESPHSNEYIYAKLKEVDPEMAEKLHPNNRRKILRSLQVWIETGRRHSDVLHDQQSEEGGCSLGGPLRYTNALVFWLNCRQDILDQRLSDRVDDMIQDGLIKELTDFHDRYNKQRIIDGQPTDYTKGVFQNIGLKEFHEYLILNETDRLTKEGIKLYKESLENLRISTRRYARRQNKMTKNRFLGHPGRQVPSTYQLDTSDVSKWNENVLEKAQSIIEHYLNGTKCPIEPEPFKTGLNYADGRNPTASHFCETCKRVFIGDFQYTIHLESNKHKRMWHKVRKEKEVNDKAGNNVGSVKAGSSSF